MSQAIYRKWRPSRFSDIIGQEHVTQTLQNGINRDRIGHAYLFCGPRGTGKTTMARLLAKAVNCLAEDTEERPCDTCHICVGIREARFVDLVEIDAASNTGVDNIRELREKLSFSPSEGRYKVYIIDEVHMLSKSAFNVLSSILVDPPLHTIFILATTEDHKVSDKIKSHCQCFNFRLLSLSEITSRLNLLAQRENLTIDPEAITLIAKEGAGSLRDAESLLDQLVASPNDEITLNRVQQMLGTASTQATSDLVEAWIENDTSAGLSVIHSAITVGTNARQFCKQIVDYLQKLLFLKATDGNIDLDLTDVQKSTLLGQSQRVSHQELIDTTKRFNTAFLTSTNNGMQPQMPLEMAFLMSVTQPIEETPSPIVVNSPEHQSTNNNQKNEQPQTNPLRIIPPNKSGVDIDELKVRWNEVVTHIATHDLNLSIMIKMGRVLSIEGTTIILGYEYHLLKERINKHSRLEKILNDELKEMFDANLTIRITNT